MKRHSTTKWLLQLHVAIFHYICTTEQILLIKFDESVKINFGPKKKKTGELLNKWLHNLYSSPNVVRMIIKK
jgi:hypothetical protein